MNINYLKILIHKLYLFHLQNFPIERGKYRLGILIHSLVGDALYEINGILLLLSPVCGIDKNLISGYCYDQYVVKAIFNALKDGGNFIDVGAHFGYMSLLAAKLLDDRGIVFSFEPSPREYNKLMQHIQLNKISNISAFNQGVGPEKRKDYFNISFLGNTGGNSRYQIAKSISRIQAEFVPINHAISSSDISSVKCVKIDTEGDEMSVLKGFEDSMVLLSKATFIVEITGSLLSIAGYRPADIYNFFERHSFKSIDEKGPKDHPQYDEIFIPI